MRLTLRTLLAYLDDLLTPGDAVEMGKRIEENKIATELVHRIRTRMRLLRLGAPKIEGKGIGVDPNSVAEYLDNTLAPDKVLDFEKVCLESDVHLAEVASCHQILAAVLDKPATVDAALRQRMYNLVHLGGTAVSSGPPPVAYGLDDLVDTEAPPVANSPPAEVAAAIPATRTSSGGMGTPLRPVLLLAGSLALVFLLVLGGLRVLGPFDGRHPLAGMLGLSARGGRQVAQNDGSVVNPSLTEGGENKQQEGGDEAGAASPENSAGLPQDRTNPEGGSFVVEGGTPKPDGEAAPNPAVVSAPGVNPVEGNGVEPMVEGAGQAAEPLVPGVKPVGPTVVPTLPKPGLQQPGLADQVGAKPGVAPVPAEKPAEAATELARFLSEEHIVCRRNADDGLWYRLARGTRLVDGDHVISLPVYRPQVLLATGVQLMLVGESSIRFKGLGEGDVPELGVDYGRLLLASAGRPGSAAEVNLAGQPGTLRFIDMDAEVGLEVRRILPEGADPAETPPQVWVIISARKGRVGWVPEGGQETIVPHGQVCEFQVGEMGAVREEEFPGWASPPSAGGLDRSASEYLAGFVRLDRPVTLSLEELAEFRKTEVRSLAARCLGVLGQYEQLWRELGNEKQYSYWDEAFDALRDGLARSPEDVSEIRKSLADLRKRSADDLYRMLRGYDAPQLAQGGAAQLVDFLEHEELDVRVLAFENLRRITESTHNYRPEKPAEARRIQIQEWRKQLKEGRIAYKMRRTG